MTIAGSVNSSTLSSSSSSIATVATVVAITASAFLFGVAVGASAGGGGGAGTDTNDDNHDDDGGDDDANDSNEWNFLFRRQQHQQQQRRRRHLTKHHQQTKEHWNEQKSRTSTTTNHHVDDDDDLTGTGNKQFKEERSCHLNADDGTKILCQTHGRDDPTVATADTSMMSESSDGTFTSITIEEENEDSDLTTSNLYGDGNNTENDGSDLSTISSHLEKQESMYSAYSVTPPEEQIEADAQRVNEQLHVDSKSENKILRYRNLDDQWQEVAVSKETLEYTRFCQFISSSSISFLGGASNSNKGMTN